MFTSSDESQCGILTYWHHLIWSKSFSKTSWGDGFAGNYFVMLRVWHGIAFRAALDHEFMQCERCSSVFCDFACLHHSELCRIHGGWLLVNSCCGYEMLYTSWFSCRTLNKRFWSGWEISSLNPPCFLYVGRTAVSSLAGVWLWLGCPNNNNI